MGRYPREDVAGRLQVQDVERPLIINELEFMARPRKQELAPSSYPSARLVEWVRMRAQGLLQYKRELAVAGIVLVVFVVSGISWAAWTQYRTNQGLEHFREGLVAIESEEYDRAIAELARAEAVLGGESRGLAALHLGEAFEKDNQVAEARAAYARVVASSESYVRQVALLRLGQGAEEAEQYDQAVEWYREASMISGPNKSEALLALGETLERQGGEEVPEPYRELLSAFPDSPMAEVVRSKTEG